MLLRMDPRSDQRAWLEGLIARTGLPPTTLAKRAGLAPTTLTRFLNNPLHATALSANTIATLERFSGVRYGGGDLPSLRANEPEADAYDPERGPAALKERIEALTGASNGLTVWTLRSKALEAIGYLPGDILIVDLNEPARPGDVVCAQLYEWRVMKAETVFRLYEPPYLVAASHDRRGLSPRLIDKDISIKGPVVLSLRARASN